jgi:DNA-binding GntR family transcriptional regulator
MNATKKRAWPQIAQTTLADRVYEAIRDRILEADLAPGEFLREQEVSQAMGVSRTPVREALGRLASEGFLERIPHRGFRVPAEPFKDLLELYPIVSALELLAGKLALPNLTEEDLERLRQVNGELARVMRGRSDSPARIRRMIALNNAFHEVFSARSGNRRLNELLQDFRTQVMRLEMWYYSSREHSEESIRDHEAIIRAIESGDRERALELLERNMLLTYTALLEETGRDGFEERSAPRG